MKYILTLLLIVFMHPSFAQSDTEQKIRTILAEQTASWNNGDLVAFMKGYWKNDSLLFVGKNGPTYGYQKTLSNYQKSYPDKTAMGNLAFNILQVKPLSADTWFVLGKWSLTRNIGNLSGHYTLLFKKIDNEWVIIADHSS